VVDGFTKRTITAMIEGVREEALGAGLIDAATFDAGVRAFYRTSEADGVFCYTFFKGVGEEPTRLTATSIDDPSPTRGVPREPERLDSLQWTGRLFIALIGPVRGLGHSAPSRDRRARRSATRPLTTDGNDNL
jgi:hypothetical protein